MVINVQTTNDAGTRIDHGNQIESFNVEEIFLQLAQGIRWAKEFGSDKIILTVKDFQNND